MGYIIFEFDIYFSDQRYLACVGEIIDLNILGEIMTNIKYADAGRGIRLIWKYLFGRTTLK